MTNETPLLIVPSRSPYMKALPKIILALTAVAALSFAYPAAVQANPIEYDYTGNVFTFVTGAYTTSDKVTGFVTFMNPLAANMPLTPETPSTFSFFDGVNTITNANATVSVFSFATDAAGGITQWDVQLHFDNGTVSQAIFTNNGFDEGVQFAPGPIQEGLNQGMPGQWTVASGSVPDAGSTFGLLLLSVTALGVAARQFKRAAA